MKLIKVLLVLLMFTLLFSVTTWDTVKLFDDDYSNYLAVIPDSSFKVLWTGTAANGANSDSVIINIGLRRPRGYINSNEYDYKNLGTLIADGNGEIALVDSSWWKKQAPDAFTLQIVDSALSFTSTPYFLNENDQGNLTIYWRGYDIGSGGDQNKMMLGLQLY